MTFKLSLEYLAEHLLFGREEPGTFSPTLPILAVLSPQTLNAQSSSELQASSPLEL